MLTIKIPSGLSREAGKAFITCFAAAAGTIVGSTITSRLTDKAIKASKPDIVFGFTK